MNRNDVIDIMGTIQLFALICSNVAGRFDDSEHKYFALAADMFLLLTAIAGFWIIWKWHISWKKSIVFFSVCYMGYSLVCIYYYFS